ncbi:MAG: hypothetical protein JXR30_02095 [Alphaproteobacteria bacterium]|nr:hypothetical protein [Alphaproteobacteria bacterium]
MKNLLAFLFFLFLTTQLSAKDTLNYTVVPHLAHISNVQTEKTNLILSGFLPQLINEFAEEQKLQAQPVEFESIKSALDTAQTGWSEEIKNLDVIGGIYYDENIAEYMTYIYPPIYEDEILVVLPDSNSFKITTINGFNQLDKSLRAVVIKGFPLGPWWQSLTHDKETRWREHVVLKTEEEARPLRVDSVNEIEEAFSYVLKGTHYFVGSNLMVRDFLEKHPQALSKIKGQYVLIKGEKVKRPIFIAINQDFLDISDSSLERKLSDKIKDLKDSGNLEKRLLESKILFREGK